jgi:hypothetical protein
MNQQKIFWIGMILEVVLINILIFNFKAGSGYYLIGLSGWTPITWTTWFLQLDLIMELFVQGQISNKHDYTALWRRASGSYAEYWRI